MKICRRFPMDCFLALLVILFTAEGAACSSLPLTPQAPASGETGERRSAGPSRLPVKEKIATSSHSVLIGASRVNYTATAGTLLLQEEDGTPRASIFFVAYTRDGATDSGRRPLTFVFNGGPGSSSVWLHLGALGPRRVQLAGGELTTQDPPYALINNDQSILDLTDLVFIDPVSTGYSRAVTRDLAREFHAVQGDIESVGDFIRLYVTRFKRWPSPKFLIGESYGSTRAAGLASHLQERHGIYLNGLVLVSVVLDFQTISFDPGNDLPHILILPAYTAAAWHHRRLPQEYQQDLQQSLKDAEHFARGEYARALMAGSSLKGEEKEKIISSISELTGLGMEVIEQHNLRVPAFTFMRELLRKEGLVIGRFDSRFTGPVRDEADDFPRYDPSYSGILGAFTATLNHYLRTELQFEEDLPYEILNPRRVQPWGFFGSENRYLNMSETLRTAMTRQPRLKVLFANGYFDLATPYAASDYTIDHLALTPALRQNILATYYPAGHMMYLHHHSLLQFRRDLAGFLQGAAKFENDAAGLD
jgi:carboxypeptidase C (cathepsin A)